LQGLPPVCRADRLGGQNLTQKKAVIITEIQKNTRITRNELVRRLCINLSAVQKQMEILKEKGVIVRKGGEEACTGKLDRVKHRRIELVFKVYIKVNALRSELI
jgi:DNA-binding MarR family transcriptional regulator